tara:strand:- start:73 stop:969 length:897 start_codon:yes stop_codon:yes gene_type:complete
MALNINGTTGISGVDGSASAPAITGTDSNTGINFASDTVNINTGGSTRATIDSNGRLGIGTTSPATDLHVSAGNSRSRFTGTGGNVNYDIFMSSDSATVGTQSNHAMKFMSNDSERMRLLTNGNLLVGRTTDTATASKIQTSSLDVYVGGDTTGISFDRTDAFQAWVAMRFRTYGSQRGYIQVNTDSTTYSTSSDYRLKENVVSISDGITRLKQLKPYRFNFKENPNKTVLDGFFAHEAAEVVPEAVVGTKDAVDDKGNIEPQGIDQSKLVPLLTAALQEAIAKIEVLETKVAALEAA